MTKIEFYRLQIVKSIKISFLKILDMKPFLFTVFPVLIIESEVSLDYWVSEHMLDKARISSNLKKGSVHASQDVRIFRDAIFRSPCIYIFLWARHFHSTLYQLYVQRRSAIMKYLFRCIYTEIIVYRRRTITK